MTMDKVRKAINEEFDRSINSWKCLVEEDNLYLIGRLEECRNAKYTVNHWFDDIGRGEWIKYWDDNYLCWAHKCSKCGSFPLTKDGTMHDEVLSEYCPHCGCKMTKEN